MSTSVQVAGAASLAGVVASIGALVYLHAVPTGLSPVRNAVSQYGISAHRWGYRLMTISMAASGASLAVALGSALRGSGVTVVLVLLGVFALARLAISWFPMDAPGTERTTTGARHGLLAIGTFLSVAIAAIRLCRVLERDTAWSMLANISRGLGLGMVVCVGILVLSRIGPDLRRAFGAIERALYVAIIAWLVVFGVACATGQL
ncbi:MAG TPA: DUF998 domain-containing protein [Acidimicrobiales bacterium]|jgi:hypothetical protein|nr:DUF998 domain-containing protein [Acidimicrobiales bacterium]